MTAPTLTPHRVISGADDFLRGAQLPTYTEVVHALKAARHLAYLEHRRAGGESLEVQIIMGAIDAVLKRIPQEPQP